MSFIKWRDSFSIGVEQFDQEHHKLVEMIDAMYQVVRGNQGDESAQETCHELVTYAFTHFANEEKAMALASYPELKEHTLEHARLREKAQQFLTRLDNHDPDVVRELYHFLREWLEKHIQECDKKYAPYINQS